MLNKKANESKYDQDCLYLTCIAREGQTFKIT